MGITAYKNCSVSAILKIIGDVKLVLNGLVDNQNMHNDVLNKLKFALGAGSFSECSCVGETLILNQTGYTCYVDSNSQLITKQGASQLNSPFLMGLGLESSATDLLQVSYPEGISVNELFNHVGPEYSAFAYVGALLFKNLSCSYIQKPPIYKENINDNSEKYWAKTENHPNCYAYTFGVVIKEQGEKQFPSDKLFKAFYVNPLEKNKGSLLSHTHAVLVKKPTEFARLKNDLQFYEKLEMDSMFGVRHVFTQSIVCEGLLAIFKITDIEDQT